MNFRTRTFLVLLALVAIVEAATFGAVLNATRSNFIEQGSSELSIGQLVFDNAIQSRTDELSVGVRVLARDFGFKRAAVSGDETTIRSALINHKSRIGADVALLISRDSEIMASSAVFPGLEAGSPFPYGDLLNGSRAGDSTTDGVFVADNFALQLVVEPVFAPDLKGWVAFGFRLDDELATQISSLTNLEVSFASATESGYSVVASTLTDARRNELAAAFAAATSIPSIVASDAGSALLLRRPFDENRGHGLDVLLSNPMSKVLAAYGVLRTRLLIVMLVAFCLAVFGARALTNTVAKPLRRFASAARRISEGHYDERVDIRSGDELGQLSTAFADMQNGIRERQEKIEFQARHDVLTGLPNRTRASELIDAAMTAQDARFSLLMIDINGFKAINDTLGHAIGDSVLRAVAELFAGSCSERDTVARHGGDEFLVLLDGATPGRARRIARGIVDELGETISLDDIDVRTNLNIGIACYPEHGTTPNELLRRAEIAMYAAKDRGDAIFEYTEGQDEDHLRRLTLVGDLRRALDDDSLELHYQPKLDLNSQRVSGAEALIRWIHPTEGFVSPEEFIPLAERAGLIRSITDFVLRTGFAQLKAWRERHIDIALCINLSAFDLLDDVLPTRVEGLLAQHGMDARSLVFEITESAIMQDVDQSLAVLQRLRGIGVRLSIDDFGTGHSSLAQLKRLPVDELKIDKSFVFGILTSDSDAAIVRSTVELAHVMGLKVTAEGVESADIQNALADMHCDIAQGYHLSKPLPASAFDGWLDAYPEQSLLSGEASNDSNEEDDVAESAV